MTQQSPKTGYYKMHPHHGLKTPPYLRKRFAGERFILDPPGRNKDTITWRRDTRVPNTAKAARSL